MFIGKRDERRKGTRRGGETTGGPHSLGEYRALLEATDKLFRKEAGEYLKGEDYLAMIRPMGTRINAEWLVDFAQTDLNNLSPGRWSDLCAEVALFSSYGPVAPRRPSYLEIWRHRFDRLKLPSRQIVVQLQSLLISLLRKFLVDGTFEFPPVQIVAHVAKTDSEVVSWTEAISVPHGFLYQVFRTLVAEGARFRRCDECTRIFLGDRKTQKYCSSRCQGRVMQRRFVAKQNKATR